MKIIIVGGGAAGFFAAINIAEKHPDYQVIILEKSNKLLSKVRVSGGGRCNVTNARVKPSELIHFYPRGNKKLHGLFKRFSTQNMVEWLKERGVDTKTEADLRMFPTSDSSQTIIDCFVQAANKVGVEVLMNTGLVGLEKREDCWSVQTNASEWKADKVVIATGSSNAIWSQLESLGLSLTPPVPSLFTFNIKDERLKGLQGLSFENTEVKIVGSKLKEQGPLLITHWGLSGPAILKLSAWGARELNDRKYQFEILVNYLGDIKPDQALNQLQQYKAANPKRKTCNYPLFELPKRFWEQLVNYCGISLEMSFGELSKKHVNKLVEELTQGRYQVHGKSTFKEEFVTSGGVALHEISLETFECKRFPNLYLAGEVLDIDALTGGFNFQACWSAGWVISESV